MTNFTLDSASKITSISINSLRYHIKKLPELFKNLPRDRFNRFLFDSNHIEMLKQIQTMKQDGLDYTQILQKIRPVQTASSEIRLSQVPEQSPSLDLNLTNSWQDKINDISKKNDYLQKINKVLYEKVQELELRFQEQSSRIQSLEDRVLLLVELQTKAYLDDFKQDP